MTEQGQQPIRALVTGANSGLGRFLTQALKATALTRETDLEALRKEAEAKPFDLIVHCAVNHQREPSDEAIYRFLNDNVLLTQTLTQIPHRKFVLISSIDVYGQAPIKHHEDEPLKLYDDKNAYSQCKIFNEAIVKKACSRPVILRPSALLGVHSRPNSAIRIIQGLTDTLTLAPDSEFNYVTHAQIFEFIQCVMQHDLEGTYNIASSTNITLSTLADTFKKSVQFGTFKYETGLIDNSKAAAILPSLKQSSLDNLLDFAKGLT